MPDIPVGGMLRAITSTNVTCADAPESPPQRRIRVSVLMRRPLPGQFSVERVFRDMAGALPKDIEASLVEVPYPSRGLLPRLRNMVFTARLQADVVHVAGDIQYCALAVRPRRCVLTVLDLVSLRRLTGWRRRILFVIWYRLPVRRARAVTTISAAVRNELMGYLPAAAHKTTVIGCPVSEHFVPASAIRLNPSEFRVLQVGTGPNKNLERVAVALERLPVHFHVIGRITTEQRHLMDHLGLSYSHDSDLSDAEMRAAYQGSDLLVFASTYEGFGLPILEAQACGLPVLTSAFPPMCDIAGDAAILVDPRDVVSIRRGVGEALSQADRRLTVAESGRRNSIRHAPKRVAEQYAATYRCVSSGKFCERESSTS